MKQELFYLNLFFGPVGEPVLFMLENVFDFYIYLNGNDYIGGKQ